jgi:hypothetical protein
MRVRIVLGVALAAVAGTLILDMSGRAPRTAGSDHASPVVFAATLPGGATLCQPTADLPGDAASVQILIGTYGRPLPDLRLSFVDATNSEVAAGHVPAGGREGVVTIPLRHARGVSTATRACLHFAGSHQVALGGETGPVGPSSEVIAGRQQPGRVSLLYFRQGKESWWSLLPELTRRFGLGKAPFFGIWTLPIAALLLLGVWAGAVRLLIRELT